MSRTKHHGSKGRPSNTCPSGRKCPTCEENRRRAGEKDAIEAKMKLEESMKKYAACEGIGVIEYDDTPAVTTRATDYDRTEPICLMLSKCDLAIIDKHKSEGQDPRDFLQRLISENLRVLRDGTP